MPRGLRPVDDVEDALAQWALLLAPAPAVTDPRRWRDYKYRLGADYDEGPA